MAQQFKVLVNAGKDQAPQTLQAEQGAGQRGRPLIIKAKAGAKYQLVEQGKGRGNDLAPDNIKAKRVGKHLHLMFETDTVADVIIEDYYDVMPEGYNGVIGKAENGSFYEYLTEDPTDPGLIPLLKDNVTAVTQALGGAEVSPAGAAVAFAAFPLLGALGLLGGAAAVAAAAKDNGTTATTGATTNTTGKLDANAPNDSGVLGDNITNDATPTLSGTVPTGSTATVTINGQTYPVTVNPNGTWSFTNPTNLPDGTYYPVLNVTTNGVTTPTNLTPFTIDTVTTVNIGSAGQVGTLNPISGTAEPGDTVVVKDANGQVIGTATANSAGNWSLTPSAPLPAGVITATATDAAGNTATGTGNPVNANSSLKSALTIDPIAADNVLLANESGATSYTVTGKVTGTFAAGDVVFLTLNGKTYPAVVKADGTYSVAVPMSELKADPDTKIEGSINPTGGDPATAAQDYTVESGNVVTQTALSIDPVTADNIINSTEGTGNIAITGKVTGKFSAGDTVTLTVNNKTFTGQAAADGSYSIAVPAADLKADADTQVDGTVTGTGGTLAKAIQDYGVDANVNPAPPASLKTALTIDPIAADNVLLASESGATTYTVTGKVTGAFAAGDVVFLSLNGKTYPAIVNADGTYSTLVSMADLKADPDTKIEGTITPTGGDIATAAQDYTVEAGNVATQTALSIDPVTADNIIGSSESSGSITLTGKVTGKFSAGDVVKLTVAGVTYSGTAAADGSYSIPVPAASLLADSDTQVDGTVTGTGGTLAKAVQDYGIAPSINPNGNSTGALTPTAPNDSGVVGDNTTNDNTPSLSGKVPTGSSATVTINGQTYPVTVNPDGTWSFTQPTNLPDGTYYPVLNVTTGGVTTPTNITPFTIDTTPPTVVVTSNAAALAAGETATITFTLSEKSTDFTADDIAVTGGTLSNVQQSPTDPKVYTATFTPSSTGTSATVSVASDKFADAAANRNTDGAEANNTVSFKTNATVTGGLTQTAPNDSGVVGDNTTNDTTPTLNGKVPSGSTATVTLNGQTYPVTVNPDGTWSFTNPTNLPDGTYTPQLNVTTNGVTTTTPITPFTIDTVPPTVIVTSGSSSLASGQTANITFTLSEVVSDFSNGDITVAGGTLSNLVQSATDPKVYTAVFTPTSTSANALATIGVASDKFSDAAANFNKDTLVSPAPAGATYEANNSVTLTTNATVSGQLSGASDNSTGTPNDHKTNDATPELTGKVPAGSTATVTINGQTYPVTVNPDGTWSFTQPTNLPDGTYTPVLNVTTNGVTTPTNITPFTIDTTPPTVIVSGTTNTLAAGQSTTLTFTLSEASNDLSGGDFVVAGGTLSALQQSATDPKVYTATFTATPGTTTASTATVSIASDKFADAAGNLNKDGADANNLWTSSITPATAPQPPASAKTALTIDPITGDNVVTLAESGATTYTVTGKVTGTFAAGDLVTLRLNDKPFYATVLADGSYSTVVPMADIKADSDTKIEGSVTGTGGQYATAAQDYTVETTNAVTQTALSINAVTADNIIGSTESTGSIAITGKVTGKFVAGDIITLTVKGINYSGTAAADGSYSIPVPAAELIADSDTAVDGTVTGTGGTLAKAVQDYGVDPNINPAQVDTTPPKIAISSNQASLLAGQTATITFTVSEATTDFTWDGSSGDIVVSGGTLGTLTHVGVNAAGEDIYTAVFTPATNSTTPATIAVAAGKFRDAAGNQNLDTYNATADAVSGHLVETNNIVTLTVNTQGNTVALSLTGDKATALEAGGAYSATGGATAGTNPTMAAASGVLSNDTGTSPTVTGIQKISDSSASPVTAGTTSGTGTSIVGQYGTLKIGADGSYTYTVNNTDAAVQALRTSANTVTDVFTYTASDASGNKTANLVVTVQGANDAPTVVIAEADKTLTAGTALTPFSIVNNFADVDSGANGETATYSAAITGGGTWPSWLTFNAATGLFTGTPPTAGVTSVDITRTDALGLTATDTFLITVNPAVDTTPPKIAISSNQASLTTGQTATITFTVSEATSDFSWDGSTGDIAVTGGTLGALTHVGVNAAGEDIYTAVFTPAANSTTPATIAVAAGKFRDAAGNQNLDTYNATADTVSGHLVETNNIVTLSVNTTTVAAALNLANDTATAVEAGGAYSATGGATAGTNPAMAAASGVLSNDTGTTPTVTSIQKLSATSATTVTAGTTSGTGTSIVGQYGTLKIGADGSYTYTVNNTDAAVQALRTSANTVTDVFTYTASDASGNKTANLVVTVQGANDAPTVVIAESDKTLTAGTALTPFSIVNNFADVDSGANGETATYSAAITGGGTWPSWLTFNAATGLFTGTPPTAGVTSVDITRTDALGLTATDTFLITVNPAVDTTPPKIAITSNQASLTTGQTATITFTISEATSDFSWDGSTGDIVVTGGALGALTHVGVNVAGEDIYTAVFTPATNSTPPATIAVAAGKFRDASGNQNLDTYNATADTVSGHLVETNNIVTLSVNTTTVAAALVLANDSASALEAGGTANGTAGNNASGSVLTNDVGATPKVTGVQKITDTTATTVSANTTSSTGTAVTGQYGTLVMGADGSYIYTIDNNNATVQSLKGSTNTLTEVFTYTANDGTGAKTANLVVTVQGANDAPVAVADVASATEAGGVANGTPGVNPTGNVLTNDTDVDLADTQAVSAIMAGIAGTPSPVTAANAAADTTGITGAHGTLKIGTDGSYSYTVNQSDAAVEALLPTSTPLTDTFTYTVKDAAGLTSTQTIVISINGAIDVPAINNSTATIDIVSATTDTGASSTDFITSDQTLSYAGTVTGWVPGLGDRVMLEFTDPVTGSVTTAFATPSSTGAWTWTDASRNPGTYILKATIVSATGTTAINTAAPVNGTNGGYDIQPVVIDTSAGTPAEINLGLSITTDANNNAFVNTTELGAATTFTSRATFDPTLAKVGMVITLSDGTTSTPITLTAAMVAAGFVEATFAKPTEGAVQTVTAKLTDIAGNVGTATVSDSATLDTTAITVAVTRAGSGTVTTSEVITFTLSEASPDFAAANVDVTGGTLSNWTKVDATHYTATFTPTAGSNGTATVGVTFDKFSDTAGNQNKDTYVSSPASGYVNDGNNIQSFAFDTRVSASLALSNDTATAVEAGGTANGTAGTNPAIAATSGVLSNDTGATPTVTGIQKISDTTATSVAAGSTGGTGGTSITGQYGTLVMGADGSYVYTVNNDNATVQALRTTANTLTDVFTYTAADASGTKTANLVVTVQGANDAPTVTVQEADKTVTAGNALTPFSILGNFADVDSTGNGETATYTTSALPAGVSFDATTGTFSGTPTTAGTTSVTVTRTDAAGLTATDTFDIIVNPVVDATPPKIAISSNQSSLSTGQTATITFTVSEATSNFVWNGTTGDLDVTGGSLSALTHVGVNAAGEDIYTAVFTPLANSTTPATIAVAAGKFTDAANNQNLDTYSASADTVANHVVETNNIVTLSVNTAVVTALNLTNDTATALEASGIVNATAGTNPTGSVLGNDTGTSPTVTGIQLLSASTATAVNAGTNSTSGTPITGQYGTLKMGADGSYVYTVDNANPNVQALRTTSNTLTEVFTYTATDGTGNKTASLAVTVQGANDAPTVVVQEADKTAIVGNALTPFSIANNFADVDSTANGETATYTATVGGAALPSWLSFNPATGTFSGTPTAAGTTTVTVTRTDAGNLSVTDTFDIVTTLPVIATTVSFSSMTKDSGTALNANWTTNDGSTGRLLSGDISAPLATGEVVKVYANGVLVGNAVVNGTKWEITDLGGYNANWTYTAQVVGAASNTGPMSANRLVTLDATEDPPAITGVFDTASSTSNALSTVKGTGLAGDRIFLYDNTYTNLVGTAVVDSNGDWSVTTLTNTFGGSNTFAAKQVDVNGNQSGLSNQWTVTTPATALNANSGFSSGMVDYTTKVTPIVITTPSNGTDDTAYIWGGNRIGVIDLQSYYQPNYSTTNPTAGASGALPIQVGAGALSAATTPATWSNGTWTQKTYTFGADSDLYTAAWKTFASLASGKILAGSADGMLGNNGSASSASNLGDLWRSSASVVAGKTYEFSFAYWNTVAKNLNTAGFMDVMIDGQKAMTTTNNTTGKVSITYTATTTGSIDLALQTWSNQNSADFVLDNLVFSEVAPANTLGSTTAGNGPTANPDTLSYTAGALDALASDDTITATSASLQATLAAGGLISGGAGLDTLKLAAGTTLNLGTLTTNQTVRPIEQVEIITMQGTNSILSMTANDVLSLGASNTGSASASNTSTMAPYSFAATAQNTIGSGATAVTPTGSTSSAGKVQMVINGVTGDTLNLNKLATDGVTTAGTQGNTGLEGFWAYKGQVTINSTVYRVYDHSTTQAQVLVDVDVTMNVETPAAQALALSNDTANAVEAGGAVNATAGTNPTGNVLGNDQGASPTVTAVQLVSNASATAVAAGTNSSTGTTITGQYGTLRMGADGSYSYAVDNANATVQGLRTASNTLSEVFTYTANDGTGPKTANLVVTIKGANDAPTLVVPEPDKTGLLVGTAISSFSIAGNFADVDSTANGETATYSASPLPAGITFNAATGTFSGTPTTAGTTTVTVTRTDAAGLTATDTFDIVIADVITKTVAFSSMTKDSGTLVGDNANWLTADASAGRLVSGTISAALGTNEVVKVYANGTEIGSARVVGQAWDITDLNGYNANWTYTAKVVNPTTSSSGATATQVVTTDFTVDAPVITGVFDSAVAGAATVAHNGSTTSPLASVSGTASANALVYLYDNTSTNLVGTAIADASGNWTVSGFGVLPTANTFAAKQVDVHGNESVLSNLWSVNTTGSGGFNGSFDSGIETGFATDLKLMTAASSFNYVQQRHGFAILNEPIAYDLNGNPQTVLATLTQSAATTWNGVDTWSEKIYAPGASVGVSEYEKSYYTFLSLASGKIFYGSLDGAWISTGGGAAVEDNSYTGIGQQSTLWGSKVDVVQGQTYQFKFDYWNNTFGYATEGALPPNGGDRTFIQVMINGTQAMVTHNSSTGTVTVNYTATSTGSIPIELAAHGWVSAGDFALDNISFAQTTPSNAANTLVAGSNSGYTDGANGTIATPLSFSGGSVNAMGGSDVIAVAAGVNLQTALATGGSYINGGSGADTLVLNAGTTLNLPALSSTQTVQPIQQVEIFKLQGTSTLTLSANDVLSLGGSHATTMSGYTSSGSTGKVQLVVEATGTDAVVLTPLSLDSVTTNGVVGNTGLAGVWSDAGTTTIGSSSYRVFNHSTTDAQVLVSGGASVNPAGTTTASQAVVITKVENSGAAASYVEEFNSGTSTVAGNLRNAASPPTYTTTTPNTLATEISTAAWEISTIEQWASWQANSSRNPVNELKLKTGALAPATAANITIDNMIGTDGRLQLGLDTNEYPTGSNDPRIYTFTSKTGPFSSVTFKSFGLNNLISGTGLTTSTWTYPQVAFYDADGNVVHRQDFLTLNSSSKLDVFTSSLPAGVTATSFGFMTLNADRWFIDEISMTSAANDIVPHLGTTADTTHKISGTYATTLNPGEVIKIYDATGTVLLGTAVVDPDTKTWTFESPTPAAVGTHPYVAKIESSASAVVATSNTYTVNILGAGQLDIASISTDSGTAGDFITSDNTIVYNGTLPQALATGEKVLVQIYAANGTTLLRSNAVSPAAGSTTWTWDDTADAAGPLADGNYVIKATIVAADGVTPVASYGARGTDVQPMVIDAAPPAQTVTFTSMTKDSGVSGLNAEWTTADASAGRLVSGALSAPLGANDVLKIYANGVEIGNATVSGTQWTITDPAAYSANWTYTAKVVDVAGGMGPQASQGITLDNTEAAAVISSVTETGAATAITDGSGTVSSAKVITTVSGTGTAGDVVYVYDNSSTNLIGSATVAAGGAWSITGLTLPAGAHTFAAVQRDALGNISPNSNLFKLAPGSVTVAPAALTTYFNCVEEGAQYGQQSDFNSTGWRLHSVGPTAPGSESLEVYRGTLKSGTMSQVSITITGNMYANLASPPTFKFYSAAGKLLRMMENGVEVNQKIITANGTQTVNTGTFLNGEQAAYFEYSSGDNDVATITGVSFTPGNTNTLTANTALGLVGAAGIDNATYNGGTMSGLGGDDVITAKVSTVQAQLSAGGMINGGSGVDTLKLQPGTTLDLTAITGNQTVKNIQEVEVFQMQGKSTLTLSANDVLSLGATDLAGYSFSGSNTASAGKVQFVVLGTASDKLNLSHLASDALGSNTGTLAGEWQDKGTVTIGGVAYQVFDHSTSKAQVLVGGGTQTATTSNGVAISSMTLDTGTAGDFITSNGAAGRTVTGTIATALSSGDRVEVYADGVLIGNATVTGTNWTINDSAAHTANWTYTAKLVTASGTTSATTFVVYDAVEAPPAITGVTDSNGNAMAASALSSGNLLGQAAGAYNIAVTADFGFVVDHTTHTQYNGNNSTLTTGPMTANPTGAIIMQYWSDGNLYDDANASGPGSMVEIASKNLMTVTKGQAYTMSFDLNSVLGNTAGTAGGVKDNVFATQLKWVLLDANGVYAADLTGWYSGEGNERYDANNATRFSVNTSATDYTNYQANFVSNLATGQYRVGLAYVGGTTTPLLDRLYFGIAKNPINSVSGTGTPGSLIQLYDNGGTTVVGSTTVSADSTWTVNGLNLAAGTHNFTAKSTDGAGNVSVASVAYNATVTPVALDLNGDGQIGYSQIKMDLNADGILDTTAWVAAQDGLLMHDLHGDGSVRSTSQFAFARHAGETDLQGLAAQFDSNHDGVLNALDAQFGEFAVWQDANQNGVADAGEVKHLAELGIHAIQLNSDGVVRTPTAGVTESGHSSAQLANGSDMLVADAAFAFQAPQAADVLQAAGNALTFKAADTVVDLASFVAHNASGSVAQVDLTGTGDNTLRLSLSDVLQQATASGQALQVKGNAGDVVELFTQGTAPVQTSTTLNGHDYAAFDLDRNGSVDLLVDQAVRVSLG